MTIVCNHCVGTAMLSGMIKVAIKMKIRPPRKKTMEEGKNKCIRSLS